MSFDENADFASDEDVRALWRLVFPSLVEHLGHPEKPDYPDPRKTRIISTGGPAK